MQAGQRRTSGMTQTQSRYRACRGRTGWQSAPSAGSTGCGNSQRGHLVAANMSRLVWAASLCIATTALEASTRARVHRCTIQPTPYIAAAAHRPSFAGLDPLHLSCEVGAQHRRLLLGVCAPVGAAAAAAIRACGSRLQGGVLHGGWEMLGAKIVSQQHSILAAKWSSAGSGRPSACAVAAAPSTARLRQTAWGHSPEPW